MKLKIKFRPRKGQSEIINSKAKFRVAVAHRRFGKTYSTLAEMLIDGCNALMSGKHKVKMAYIAPTYSQAKRIAWSTLKDLTDNFPNENGWYHKYNEAELRFEFGNADNFFTIYLLGAENYDNLRGIGLYRVVLDEFGDMNSKVWDEVIYPTTLDDEDSRVTFIGTPKGRNQFYDLYEAAKNKPNWERFFFDINTSGVFSEDQIDEIKEQYADNPEAFDQEFLLSWSPSVKGSIYLDQVVAAKNSGRVGLFPYDNRVVVSTAWDLGMDDNTTIIFFQQVGREIRIVDSYTDRGKGLDFYVTFINQWRDNHNATYDRHFAPHDIKVREYSSGKSRIETAAKLGLHFTPVQKMSIEDGINAVRQLIPRCYFHAKTTIDLVDAVSQYRRKYNDKAGVYSKKPIHDRHSHYADALRYLAIGIKNNIMKTKLGTVVDDNWSPV